MPTPALIMNANSDPEKADAGEQEQREYAARTGARFADGQSLAEYTTNASEKAGSSRYAESSAGLEHVKAAKAVEKKLVRKLGESRCAASVSEIQAHRTNRERCLVAQIWSSFRSPSASTCRLTSTGEQLAS